MYMHKQSLHTFALAAMLTLLAVGGAHAQGNLPYVDDRPLHFGFFVGMNTLDFGIGLSQAVQDDGLYQADVSSLMPGFSAGIIGDLRLGRYLNLRLSPSINFCERRISYQPVNGGDKTSTNIVSIPLMVPIHLKYSAERVHNFRPYLLAGGGAWFEFGRDKEKPVLLKPFDYYVELGAGCDIYFPFFKFAPELRFAIGFNDMLMPLDQREGRGWMPPNKDDYKYTKALSRLTTRMVTLVFNFE